MGAVNEDLQVLGPPRGEAAVLPLGAGVVAAGGLVGCLAVADALRKGEGGGRAEGTQREDGRLREGEGY